MTLNSNSISAKLYRYFYSKQNMPESLCTYFWALVLAYLFIIPLEITGLIGTLMRFVFPIIRDTPSNPTCKTFISIVCFWCGVLIYFMLIPVLQFFYHFEEKDILGAKFIDVLIFIIFMIIYFSNTNRRFLVIEYTKAKIKGICPRITWK
jgi:amino acid transporter